MKKIDKILLGTVVAVICLMSIGYSVLNSNLNITGELTYRPDQDVRIIDFKPDGVASDMTIQYADFSKKEVKIGCTPSSASATATYQVTVTNKSSHLYVIQKVDKVGDGNLDYEFAENYKLGTPIPSGQTVTFKVKFKVSNAGTFQATPQALTLKFDFVRPYAAILIYNNSNSPTNCVDVQCALDELYGILKA